MKYQKGAMKYDLDEINDVQEEFSNGEKDVILDTKVTSRFKGVGGVAVAARKGESIDSLLKRFKKNIIESNVLGEYQEKLTFVKPSVIRRQKKINRKYKARRSELNKY